MRERQGQALANSLQAEMSTAASQTDGDGAVLHDRMIVALVCVPLLVAAFTLSSQRQSILPPPVNMAVSVASPEAIAPQSQPAAKVYADAGRSALLSKQPSARPLRRNSKALPAMTSVTTVSNAALVKADSGGGDIALLDVGPTGRQDVDPHLLLPHSIAAASVSELDVRQNRCVVPQDEGAVVASLALTAQSASNDAAATGDGSTTRNDFGSALAEAAENQLREFIVYNDGYRQLPFPMGDVATLFGVCTDVVIRAYRSLGIDLQALVHAARVGSGDASIDHRRTAVLRRFFAKFGQTLPITDVSDDYLPGDIVTYDRPQNSGSRSHIAIVSKTIAPSGRPMIVHNRAWGPQIEDGLFVDRITGHYRYWGQPVGKAKIAKKPELAVFAIRRQTSARASRVVLRPVGQRRVRRNVTSGKPLKRTKVKPSKSR